MPARVDAVSVYAKTLPSASDRIGAKVYSLAELKTIQEVLSLSTFLIVAWLLFDQRPGPSQIVGFLLIAGGAFFIFRSPLG